MTIPAHNDIGDLSPDPAGAASLRAAVIIPVYNRGDLLARTLAGLSRSTVEAAVIVVDDGSDEDIAATVAAAPVPATYLRQPRAGYGAGRARNLGASRAGNVDLLIFIDADCVPAPDLVERHLAWQAAAPGLVSVGSRRHVRLSDVEPADIGRMDLESRVEHGFSGKADFRDTLVRRTSRLRTGDEAFRMLVSSNVAIPAALFAAVGGFDERFDRWGGEDTELGWRLWQTGALFVAADDAVVYHQLDADESGGEEGRRRARHLNDGIITTLIPHGFYRKPRRDILYEVPKVSLVLHHPPPSLNDIWADATGQTAPDWELILTGIGPEHEPTAGLLSGDPRVRVAADLGAGIKAARGELVVTWHGAVALDHRFLARLVKHFHDRPTTSSLTVGYTLPSDPVTLFLNQPDATAVDATWGGDLPLVTVARRRDWAKVASHQPGEGWALIRSLHRPDHLPQGLVWVPSATPAARPLGFVANRPSRAEMVADLRAGPRRALRTVAKAVRSRARGVPYSIPTSPRPAAEPPPDGRIHARYVGWVGYDNLGDEAMLEAVRRLLPWADVEVSGTPRDLLLLGGGTLINRSTYLGWLAERDSPRLERAVLGTGVASPEFWGLTERPEDWVRWLDSCAYVGVRGPRSEETLRQWGYRGPLEVCGDPALLFERPGDVPPRDGLVVVSPAWTNGELWGGSDEAVMEGLAACARRWLAEGREVAFLSANPSDDRPIFEMMRAVGRPDLEYLAGYRDISRSLTLLASASLVIGERLHAAVLAAAVGTPFVAVEYRPKLADFAASVGAEAAVVRTDEVSPETIGAAAEAALGLRTSVAERVEIYRRRLRHAAEIVHRAVQA